MYCKMCGNILDEKDLYCKNCGASVKDSRIEQGSSEEVIYNPPFEETKDEPMMSFSDLEDFTGDRRRKKEADSDETPWGDFGVASGRRLSDAELEHQRQSGTQYDEEFHWNIYDFPKTKKTEDINFIWDTEILKEKSGEMTEPKGRPQGERQRPEKLEVEPVIEMPRFTIIPDENAGFGQPDPIPEDSVTSADELSEFIFSNIDEKKEGSEDLSKTSEFDRLDAVKIAEPTIEFSGRSKEKLKKNERNADSKAVTESEKISVPKMPEAAVTPEPEVVESVLDTVAAEDVPASLEEEIFSEVRADQIRGREDNADRFFTFSKKNEEFQRLLDKEYERLHKRDEEKIVPDPPRDMIEEEDLVEAAAGSETIGMPGSGASGMLEGLESMDSILADPVELPRSATQRIKATPEEVDELAALMARYITPPESDPMHAAYAAASRENVQGKPGGYSSPTPVGAKAPGTATIEMKLPSEGAEVTQSYYPDGNGVEVSVKVKVPQGQSQSPVEVTHTINSIQDGGQAPSAEKKNHLDEMAAARAAYFAEAGQEEQSAGQISMAATKGNGAVDGPEESVVREGGQTPGENVSGQAAGQLRGEGPVEGFDVGNPSKEVPDLELTGSFLMPFERLEAPEKKWGVVKILLTIVLILLIIELGILGIKFFMPDSKAAGYINSTQEKAVTMVQGWFGGNDEDENDGGTDSGTGTTGSAVTTSAGFSTSGGVAGPAKKEPYEDKDFLVYSQRGNNKDGNIVEVRANNSLKFALDQDYSDDIKNSQPITDNRWFTTEDGSTVYYDAYIIGSLISFNSQWVDYVNDKDDSAFQILKEGSNAYKKAKSYKLAGKIQETFDLLEIGEIRQGAKGFYVWTHEKITTTQGQKTESKENYWVYYLEPVEKQMKVVDYVAYEL